METKGGLPAGARASAFARKGLGLQFPVFFDQGLDPALDFLEPLHAFAAQSDPSFEGFQLIFQGEIPLLQFGNQFFQFFQ